MFININDDIGVLKNKIVYIVYKHQRKDSIYICTKEEIHDDEIRVYWYLIFFSVHKKEIQDDEIGVYWYLFFFCFFSVHKKEIQDDEIGVYWYLLSILCTRKCIHKRAITYYRKELVTCYR